MYIYKKEILLGVFYDWLEYMIYLVRYCRVCDREGLDVNGLVKGNGQNHEGKK